jgi:hypothetical protein
MKDMDFKKKLIAMRNSIQDYLDAMDMDEVENKKPEPKGSDKKPEPKGEDKSDVEEDEDGKKKEH